MTESDRAPGREGLLEVIEELQADLRSGAEWENHTLETYLDAFAGLLDSIENSYVNIGQPVPTDPWVILADVFRGARYYE